MTTALASRPRTGSEPRTGPYARVPHCPDHTNYRAGCRRCRRYQAWTARRHRRSVELGQPLTYDISQVRAHLRSLQQAGMLLDEISKAAHVNRSTISGILYQANRRFVCRDNARSILAVEAPDKAHTPPTSNLVPAAGTIRRVRALARLGWTYAHIIAASGSAVHRLDQVGRQEWVTGRFAAAIVTAYEALSMQPGPSKLTAARAVRAGWPPPIAWDDDTIDDPAAVPDFGSDERPDTYDETTVVLAVAGGITYAQLNTHRPDLVETIRRLAATTSDLDIAHLLRVPGAAHSVPGGGTRGQLTVAAIRKRAGIPACERPAAVYAYPRRRDRARRTTQAA